MKPISNDPEHPVKVHVTLQDDVRRDPVAKHEAMLRIATAVRLANLNPGRFQRHGIISADVAPADIAVIEQIEGVKSVSIDSARLTQP